MGLTRREFLAAVLGAPLAASACRKSPAPRRFSGRLLGQSDALGHRLRAEPPRASGEKKTTGVLIVGGGIAGLTAGWRLLRAGFDDFTLLELEPVLGGTARGEATHAWAAHYVPTPDPSNRSLVTLLDEMGLIESRAPDGRIHWAEEALCRAPQERLFYKGAWYEGLYLFAGASAEDLRLLRAFNEAMNRWAAYRDRQGRRAFALPMAHGSDDPELVALDQLSMAAWLDQNGFTSPRLRWFVEYGCRDDYGLTLDQISAWAGIFYFAARLEKPGDKPSEFLTWPEGNNRLVRHFAAAIGARARAGCLVTDLAPAGEGIEAISFDSTRGVVESWQAQDAICATPALVTRRIVAPYRKDPPAHLAAFEYTPWAVANIQLRSRPGSKGFPTAWDNVLYESRSLGYVVDTHQTGRDHGPTSWTWYWALCNSDPSVPRRELLEASWDRWADAVVSDLDRAHEGFLDAVESIDVFRWGHAMVRPRVGFIWSPARRNAQGPLGPIHFAHTELSGKTLVEEAVWHGVRAAEEVLRKRGISFESLL